MTKTYPSFCGHITAIPETIWKRVCEKAGVYWDYTHKQYIFQRQRVQKPDPESREKKEKEIELTARFYNFSYAYMKERDFEKALERVENYEDDKGNPIYLPAYLPEGETFSSYTKLMEAVDSHSKSLP